MTMLGASAIAGARRKNHAVKAGSSPKPEGWERQQYFALFSLHLFQGLSWNILNAFLSNPFSVLPLPLLWSIEPPWQRSARSCDRHQRLSSSKRWSIHHPMKTLLRWTRRHQSQHHGCPLPHGSYHQSLIHLLLPATTAGWESFVSTCCKEKKADIICTIGPKSWDPEAIKHWVTKLRMFNFSILKKNCQQRRYYILVPA